MNAILTPAQAKRIAIMAQDGLARSLRPVHTPLDGDAVFVMATGERPLRDPALAQLTLIGSIAADCSGARGRARGVRSRGARAVGVLSHGASEGVRREENRKIEKIERTAGGAPLPYFLIPIP